MTTALERPAPTLDPSVVRQVILGGDLTRLNDEQKLSFYNAVCNSVGLNPLTRPFAYLRLNGKEVLYARKDATEQLRFIHKISIDPRSFTREVIEGTYVVTAAASMPNGRTDVSTGAVPIQGLGGENRANAMMKAETKAKRRVTLSICGLGMLDETEIESIPGAASVPMPVLTVPAMEKPVPMAALTAEAAESAPPLTSELPAPAAVPPRKRRAPSATGAVAAGVGKSPVTVAQYEAEVIVLATQFVSSEPPHYEIHTEETEELPFEEKRKHLLLTLSEDRYLRALAGEGTGEVFTAKWRLAKRPNGAIGKVLESLDPVLVQG